VREILSLKHTQAFHNLSSAHSSIVAANYLLLQQTTSCCSKLPLVAANYLSLQQTTSRCSKLPLVAANYLSLQQTTSRCSTLPLVAANYLSLQQTTSLSLVRTWHISSISHIKFDMCNCRCCRRSSLSSTVLPHFGSLLSVRFVRDKRGGAAKGKCHVHCDSRGTKTLLFSSHVIRNGCDIQLPRSSALCGRDPVPRVGARARLRPCARVCPICKCAQACRYAHVVEL